jgi:hypothetical protein
MSFWFICPFSYPRIAFIWIGERTGCRRPFASALSHMLPDLAMLPIVDNSLLIVKLSLLKSGGRAVLRVRPKTFKIPHHRQAAHRR